jgi:hypothetical protein
MNTCIQRGFLPILPEPFVNDFIVAIILKDDRHQMLVEIAEVVVSVVFVGRRQALEVLDLVFAIQLSICHACTYVCSVKKL